jgi:chorismate synthase
MALRYLTAGESHGPVLVGILDGLPAGMPLTERDLAPRMKRRMSGCGRGKRMTFEADRPQIVGGVWKGETTGAPLAVLIENRSNRQGRTTVRKTVPRPGHADLAGMLKYGFADANPVIERASARETAMRVALGAAACRLLELAGARLAGHVIELGGIPAAVRVPGAADGADGAGGAAADRLEKARDASPVASADPRASKAMVARIDEATARGETLGGRVELIVWGLPPGLGSYVQHDRRLDARLAAALAAIPSVKEVELGDALAAGRSFGHDAHDVIARAGAGLGRESNHAGGLEGGVTNGQPLVARLTLKPISTLRRPLPSVDLDTGRAVEGRYVRSDVTVVPAATVIAEAVAGIVLADALLEKFGADALSDLLAALAAYRGRLPRWPKGRGR